MLIYYNTTMFDAAGIDRPSDDWTWDDFLAVAKQLTTGTGSSKVYGFVLPTYNFGLTPWYYTNGGSSATETERPAPDRPETDRDRSVPRGPRTSKDGSHRSRSGADPYQLFPAGKVAMTGAGELGGARSRTARPRLGHRALAAEDDQGHGLRRRRVRGLPGSQNPDLAWEYSRTWPVSRPRWAWSRSAALNPSSRHRAEPGVPEPAPALGAVLRRHRVRAAGRRADVFSTLDPASSVPSTRHAGGDPAEALATAAGGSRGDVAEG